MPAIKIGCDPELFAFTDEGVPVSVHDLLPGTKYDPVEVPGGAVQVDGVAAEFNIVPAASRAAFLKNIKSVRSVMQSMLDEFHLVLKEQPTVFFKKDYFDSLPDIVKVLGCEPDYDAYTEAANPKPETDQPMRTGSGHVHIGWLSYKEMTSYHETPEYIQTVLRLVKNLDATLYVASKHWDNDTVRHELYGKPGCFRFKPYGAEYRVLSNRWLADDALIKFVYDTAKRVTELTLSGVTPDNLANYDLPSLPEIAHDS